MPGFDGTGPRGMGPMTGGGRGYCAVPGDRRGIGFGRGFWGHPIGGAFGARRGLGRRAVYGGAPMPAMTPQDEFSSLREAAQALEEQIRDLRSRMDELS